MNTTTKACLNALSLCLVGTAAQAEWRCDCTTIVDSCSATVTVQESWVDVTSDQAQCARVDYFIDGLPFVALVVDGQSRQDWLAGATDPDVLIQSCQVCVDRSGDAPPADASADAEPGEFAPLIEVEPDYPENAAVRGIEGYAEVAYTVDDFGRIVNPSVTAAEPAGVFDRAALDAIGRWRYPAEEGRDPVMLTHRFEFDIAAALLALTPTQRDTPAARREISSRNQCVREQISYDYGEMIEVGLMNACAEPIVVFSCAEGVGRNAGQWVCASSTQSDQALLPPGDRRIGQSGAVTLTTGVERLQFAGEMFVARAPNSQYWWLACNAGDSGCRSSGDQWLRSMNRQLASIDPQARIQRPLARAN